MRHDPYVMKAHSAKTCQCSSRTPPAVSRMLTPAMVSEIWKSACVTCRAQPPFWIRFGALLNDAQNCGRSPTSVAGGDDAAGNWSASTGLCGPGSVTLAGFAALSAPCGGWSGLPNEAVSALAERTEAAASPPTAPSRLRRVVSSMTDSTETADRAQVARLTTPARANKIVGQMCIAVGNECCCSVGEIDC